MSDMLNIPCQVCSVTSTKGEIIIFWIKFRDDDGDIRDIIVDSTKQSGANALHTHFYECTGTIGEAQCMVKLSFDPSSMCWTIIGKIY